MTDKKFIATIVALIVVFGTGIWYFAKPIPKAELPEVTPPVVSVPSVDETSNSEVTPPVTEVFWKKEIPDVMGKPKAEAEKILKDFKAKHPEFIYKIEVVETEATSLINIVFFADYVDNIATKETYYSVLVSKETEPQQEIPTEETTKPPVVGEGDKVSSKPTENPDYKKTDAEKMAELLERDRDKSGATGEGYQGTTEITIIGDKLPGASFG